MYEIVYIQRAFKADSGFGLVNSGSGTGLNCCVFAFIPELKAQNPLACQTHKLLKITLQQAAGNLPRREF